MNSLLRSLLSFLILLPPSVSGRSLENPVRKEAPMQILAALGAVPKPKQSRQLSLALSVGALDSVDSLKESAVLLERSADDRCHVRAGSALQPLQILNVSASEPNGTDSLDLLHNRAQANLQGESTVIDDRGQSKGRSAFTCNTKDIQIQPEISASRTADRSSRNPKISDISSSPTKVPALLDRILRSGGRTLGELEELTLAEVERLRREESTEFLSARVLLRLQTREAKEPEASYKTTYSLAWRIVWHCHRGDAVECTPVTLSYYEVVGCHEDQFYDRLMIRRAAMFGKPTSFRLKHQAGKESGFSGSSLEPAPPLSEISARTLRGKAEPSRGRPRATPPSKKSAPVPQIKKQGATA